MAGKFCELARYTRSPGSPAGVVRTVALSDRWGCRNQSPEAICELVPVNVNRNAMMNREAPPFNSPDLRYMRDLPPSDFP